jgi:ankyrin repeat protein
MILSVVERLRLSALATACAIAGASLLIGEPAGAQTPPSAGEAESYGPLHAAAYRGDAAALRLQLAADATADPRDRHGRTPLHVATFRGHHDAIRVLAAAGADLGALENDRYDAVTIASVADDEATLQLLLSLGASARLVTSRYDGTALIAAAHLGHDGVVKQLVEAGAPLDHVNNLHWTAVIESIVLGDGGTRTRRRSRR